MFQSLFQLNISAKFGKFVRSISLPETFEDIEAGTVCETAGWGWMGNKYADSLMEVNVTVLNRSDCKKYFRNSVTITENMMCTKVGPERQDICSVSFENSFILIFKRSHEPSNHL